MSAFASISPWLPLLKEFLPSIVVLREKAAELYHLSLMGKSISVNRIQTVCLGVEKSGKKFRDLHNHLMRLGFQRTTSQTSLRRSAQVPYFREDLGELYFLCPQTRAYQRVPREGLWATPDKKMGFLIENPHCVEVQYLGNSYEVLIPQVGRFILDNGLGLKGRRFLAANEIYKSARKLTVILELLVVHPELQEEVLHDFLEVRPPSLVGNFLAALKENGPGSILWESAQKLYLERNPETKIVSLTRWYWDFLPKTVRFLEKQKNEAS